MQAAPDETEQASAVMATLCDILGDGLLAVYLHGSAVSGGLRPQSDIDLLAVAERSLTKDERAALLSSLLRLSARYPAVPGERRYMEVIVFSRRDLADNLFPARAEFIYGEWLRDAFEAGEEAMPVQDPGLTLVLAQARQEARPLFGPAREVLLPETQAATVRRAMHDLLPSLLEGLQDDTRNFLLTLARMWHNACRGTFASKDEAALWAIPKLTGEEALTLEKARQAYLGEIADSWHGDDLGAARRLADQLAMNLAEATTT